MVSYPNRATDRSAASRCGVVLFSGSFFLNAKAKAMFAQGFALSTRSQALTQSISKRLVDAFLLP